MATHKVIPIQPEPDFWQDYYRRNIERAQARSAQPYCMNCGGNSQRGCECWCGCGAPIAEDACKLHGTHDANERAQEVYIQMADKIAVFALMLLWVLASTKGVI